MYKIKQLNTHEKLAAKTSSYLIKVCLICIVALLYFSTSKAQTSKIGIVFDADTTFVNQHIGFTIFTNSTDSSSLNVDLKEYITQKLKSHLETKYAVDTISLPDSLRNVEIGLLESGIGRKLSRWANTKQEEYDIIIFIRNQDIPYEWNIPVPRKTSGIYTRRQAVYLYTTITYYAYQTAKGKLIDYYNLGGNLLQHLKGFKLPKEKDNIDNETFSYLKEEYEKYLDQRIEHFLSKSFLMPDLVKRK